MSSIPLDLERRCEQRWAARFEAARALREQHRLERQQQQRLIAPGSYARPLEGAELPLVHQPEDAPSNLLNARSAPGC